MDIDFDDSMPRALRRYVRLVSEALGLHGESSYVQADESVTAYIALDRRLDRFPERDLALLWDEDHGWSAAIETHSGEDLLVIAYFGRDRVPPPAAVAAWADELASRGAADPVPAPRAEGSLAKLAVYAVPVWADTLSLSDADV